MLRGVVDESFGHGTRVMPERPSRLGIEGECVVGGGDEHDSVYDNRSNFKVAGVRCVKDPLGAKLCDVTGMDFAKCAVAAASVQQWAFEVIQPGLRQCWWPGKSSPPAGRATASASKQAARVKQKCSPSSHRQSFLSSATIGTSSQ